MKHSLIITIVVAVIAVAGGFFGGMKYQQTKSPAFLQLSGRTENGTMLRRGGQGNNAGFRPINGEIISADESSVTVKLSDGSSKIVIFSDTTSISKSDAGTSADLAVGTTIAAFGTENSDGSVTAQNIQLNPTMRIVGDTK